MTAGARDMFQYCNAVMEPWDGPAAICGTDGRWVIAGLDRNGLRPLRYTITARRLLVVGSETGMVKVAEGDIVSRGRLGPGQTVGLDLDEGGFYHDDELLDMLSARQDFGGWASASTRSTEIVPARRSRARATTGEELRRRQLAVGTTLEELEVILHPMVADRQRGGRQHGRRHPARGAVRALPRPVALFPPGLQPGHQPADRQPARDPGDEPEHPARQPRQRAGRGRAASASCCSSTARC